MFGQFVTRRILDAQEARLGASVDYLRHIARVAPPLLRRLGLFQPLASYRNTLPVDAAAVAEIVVTRAQDCGSCVQIAVNLGRRNGVAPEVLRAALHDGPENLPEPLSDVYRFTRAVVQGDDEPALRTRLTQHYGESAVAELAVRIAAAAVYPIIKRGLGYATSCSLVHIQL